MVVLKTELLLSYLQILLQLQNIEITDASSNNSISVFVSGEGIYDYALDNINGPYQESNVFYNVEPWFSYRLCS